MSAREKTRKREKGGKTQREGERKRSIREEPRKKPS